MNMFDEIIKLIESESKRVDSGEDSSILIIEEHNFEALADKICNLFDEQN